MNLKDLLNTYFKDGIVEAISIRPERMNPVKSVENAYVEKNVGLVGDHYQNKGGARQITLIQAEHLEAVASMLGTNLISPESTRRNIVVRGLNLLALKGKRFLIGEALLEYSGECHPCSRMEKNLGAG